MEAFILSHGVEEVTTRWLESDYLLVSCQSKEAARIILENGFFMVERDFYAIRGMETKFQACKETHVDQSDWNPFGCVDGERLSENSRKGG